MNPWLALAFLGTIVVVGIQSVAMAWLWYRAGYRDGILRDMGLNPDGTRIKQEVSQ